MSRFSFSFALSLSFALSFALALCASLSSCDIHRSNTETPGGSASTGGSGGSSAHIADVVRITWQNDTLFWEMDNTYISYCAFCETDTIEASGKRVEDYAKDEVKALAARGELATSIGYGNYKRHFVTRISKDGSVRLKTGVSYTAYGLYMNEKNGIISDVSYLTFMPENQ